MRWLSLMTKEGAKDKYAVGYVTHTVAKVITKDGPVFEAWRIGPEVGEGVQLGVFPQGEDNRGFEMAKLCVENDARAQRQKAAA
jgi:hypothetical protein